MTVEEIKQTTTMRDVLDRYGVKVDRNGMCCCPIHKERHPSMKVYPDGYKCFACNSAGDIFKFVQEMENCSFKDAFILLGGTYEHEDNSRKRMLMQMKYKRQREREARMQQAERDFREMLENAIFKCKVIIRYHEPFSDKWCAAQNALPWLTYVWDLKYIENEEINRADVIRVCKRIEGIRHTV